MIAERSGAGREEQDEIYTIALLHDIGKIGIPIAIINKPARLTDQEYEIMKTHTTKGFSILEIIEEMPKLATGARSHHERYDGRGYPDHIAGDKIPKYARIISVADAYDAMTSRRSYREAMSQELVRREIEQGIGTQFDPMYAKIMLQLIDEDKDYTMREVQ
jgi:putative two-component system response regulator